MIAHRTALAVLILFMSACRFQPDQKDKEAVRMEETIFEGRAHYRVQTPALDYYYDIRGGGFSRIIDKQGKDWIGFKTEPWGTYPASAASAYRGLPNLVFQGDDDGAGHPGHDLCASRIESGRIVTESLSGRWKWSWEFHEDHAILNMLRTDPVRAYWFLYEGTPGGAYDPGGTFFGSSLGGPIPAGHDYFKGDILRGTFRWIYVWNRQAEGTFFMIQENEDSYRDLVSFLGNTEKGMDSPDGMTVIGFGRDRDATPLLKDPQRFIIGLYPGRIEDVNGHTGIRKFLEGRFLN
jgi:hypothetical protein